MVLKKNWPEFCSRFTPNDGTISSITLHQGETSMQKHAEIDQRRQIVEIGQRIYDRFFVAANDGNLSARLNRETILMTPTGVSKGFMTPEGLIKMNLDGQVLGAAGRRPASSETPMHLAIYRVRPDVGAVVHTHAPAATAFAASDVPLDAPLLPEVLMCLGPVAMVPYARAGTDALPRAMAPYLAHHDAFLLANHGAVTVGRSLEEAYFRTERLELFARIRLNLMALGAARELPAEEAAALKAIWRASRSDA
jgi:L-fuculose-phosphate aldolase